MTNDQIFQQMEKQSQRITRNWISLTPSYGRDYQRAQEAKADFVAGKDFTINDFQYGVTQCSIRDFASGVKVNIRYKSNTQVTTVTVP